MTNRLLKKVSHLFHPVQGEIWCLHRVIENRSKYPSNQELEITPLFLDTQIRQYNANGFDFISIDQLLKEESFIPRKRVNISFDDGFRDIYTNAYPILKKYSVPFTVYLTTNFPEGNADIWWIQLEKGRTPEEYEALLKRVYESGRPLAEAMHELTGTTPDLELSSSLSLSWDEIREMVDSGLCTIGSHTVSHQGLTRISPDKCKYELKESKRIIKERTGIDAVHFSYPHSMQDDAVRKAVSDAGYVSAALGYGGCIRKDDDLFLLNRKYIIQG